MLQYLDSDGAWVGDAPAGIDDALLEQIFHDMALTRAFDRRALRLARTGAITGYYPCAGQEALASVAHALRDTDWVFPAYREQALRIARGVSLADELKLFAGWPQPTWDIRGTRVMPANTAIGSHLPHAVGFARAQQILGTDDIAVAVFGDGATSEGDFHAAMNFAGVWNAPVLLICQNNQYAQTTPLRHQTASASIADKALAYGIRGVRVDGMDPVAVYLAVLDAAERARNGEGPALLELVTYRYSGHASYEVAATYRTRGEEAEWRSRDPLARTKTYLSAEGVDVDAIEAQARQRVEVELDAAVAWMNEHDVPAPFADRSTSGRTEHFVPAEGVTEGDSETLTMLAAINRSLADALDRDDRVVLLGQDIGAGGVFGATAGLVDAAGTERVMDAPLNEQGIVGTAIGMALAGLHPVTEIQFAGFVLTAVDQIAFHAARYATRTSGEFAIPMVIRMPAGGSHGGYEGHNESPEAVFAHVPGVVVAYPATPADASGLLATAMEHDGPVVFLETTSAYGLEGDVPPSSRKVPFGVAARLRHGDDITVVTYGACVADVLVAADRLAVEGVSCDVLDLRTITPWDSLAVLRSVERTRRLVVVHDAPRTSGFGAEIIATVAEHREHALIAPPRRVTHSDLPYAPAMAERHSRLDPDHIAAEIRAVLIEPR